LSSSDEHFEDENETINPCCIMIPNLNDGCPSDPEGYWDWSPRSRGVQVPPPRELNREPLIFSDFWEESEDDEKQGEERDPPNYQNEY